tara:strand:- start:177 stop:1058 length:882 start_codon:yes stop_codon:yes gene_type:complete
MKKIDEKKKTFINLLLLILGIFIFLKITSKNEFTYFIEKVNSLFFFSFLFFLFNILIASLRFQIILNKAVNFMSIVRLNIQSFFFFFFLPVGVGSDIYRFAKLKKILGSFKNTQVINLVILDRLTGLISFIILTFFFLICIYEKYFFLLLLLFIPILLKLSFSFFKKFSFIDTLVLNNLDHRRYLKAIIYSLASQLCLVICIFLVVIFHNISFDFFHSGFIISSSSILSIVPLSLLGISVTEISSYSLYTYYGLNSNDALFLTLNFYFLKFSFSVVGAIFFLRDFFAKGIKTK